MASRETVFLLNNLFLCAFMFTVLIGTLYPLVAEALRGVKVSVGEPFFNKMTLPMCSTLLFLMGVGPALPWRRASAEVMKRQLLPPTVAAIVGAAIALAAGARNVHAVLTVAFGAFALVANVREYLTGVMARQRAHGEGALTALGRLIAGNRRRYGGYLAHIGIIVVATGVAASSTFKTEHEATLKKGASMAVGKMTVRLDEVWGREEAQRSVIGATMRMVRDGKVIGTVEPKMNFYPTSQQPVPTPAVRSSIRGDVYMNLMAFQPDGSSATVRVILEPLVPWIWIGGMIVCLGGFLAAYPDRRRVAAVAPVPVPTLPVAGGAISGATS
jgi:cytochrome c-type biogenesis protein CcmF